MTPMLTAKAQLDPGEFEIFQNGRKVGEIFVPERAVGQSVYVEHWVLFSNYVYPNEARSLKTKIKAGGGRYLTEEDFFARVPWDPGYRYTSAWTLQTPTGFRSINEYLQGEERIMKTSKQSTKVFTTVMALVALAAVFASLTVRRVSATAEVNEFPSPLCVTRGQTLQLNVANYDGPDTMPIMVNAKIVDQDGEPLAQMDVELLPGRTAFVLLNANEITQRTEYRILTRAVVTTIGDPHIRNLGLSLEVIDNDTQKTVLLHPGISRGFDPQPDPPGIPR